MNMMQCGRTIQASCKEVWNTLWNGATCRQWTAVSGDGSYAAIDWKEGSKVLFLAGNEKGRAATVTLQVSHRSLSLLSICVP